MLVCSCIQKKAAILAVESDKIQKYFNFILLLIIKLANLKNKR